MRRIREMDSVCLSVSKLKPRKGYPQATFDHMKRGFGPFQSLSRETHHDVGEGLPAPRKNRFLASTKGISNKGKGRQGKKHASWGAGGCGWVWVGVGGYEWGATMFSSGLQPLIRITGHVGLDGGVKPGPSPGPLREAGGAGHSQGGLLPPGITDDDRVLLRQGPGSHGQNQNPGA